MLEIGGNKMDRPFFEPWIGENYESGGIFGKKILALGDSHYCDSCVGCGVAGGIRDNVDFTKNTVKEYLGSKYGTKGWPTTYKKFERTLSGNFNTEKSDAISIWNSIAFYNFLQTANNSYARTAYLDEYYDKSLPYFWTVLDELAPDIVIVWGWKVWQHLPDDGCVKNVIDNYEYAGYYERNGKKITFMGINHPSSIHPYGEESEIINSLLKR